MLQPLQWHHGKITIWYPLPVPPYRLSGKSRSVGDRREHGRLLMVGEIADEKMIVIYSCRSLAAPQQGELWCRDDSRSNKQEEDLRIVKCRWWRRRCCFVMFGDL